MGWPNELSVRLPFYIYIVAFESTGRRLVESNQLYKSLYFSLPSQVLGIIRIGQVLVGSVSE